MFTLRIVFAQGWYIGTKEPEHTHTHTNRSNQLTPFP